MRTFETEELRLISYVIKNNPTTCRGLICEQFKLKPHEYDSLYSEYLETTGWKKLLHVKKESCGRTVTKLIELGLFINRESKNVAIPNGFDITSEIQKDIDKLKRNGFIFQRTVF